MSGEAIDTCTRSIRRGSGHGTSEGWFVVIRGDPLLARVAASTSRQVAATAGVAVLHRAGGPDLERGISMLLRRARRMDANLTTRRVCWEQA
jgi:hypothetical protein